MLAVSVGSWEPSSGVTHARMQQGVSLFDGGFDSTVSLGLTPTRRRGCEVVVDDYEGIKRAVGCCNASRVPSCPPRKTRSVFSSFPPSLSLLARSRRVVRRIPSND